jgi:hypothetical protein
MSTAAWFREFERQEAMREERLDNIRAKMSDGPKPPRYEAREFPPTEAHVERYGVFDTFAQAFCIGDGYSSMPRAAVAAGRLNAAKMRADAP